MYGLLLLEKEESAVSGKGREKSLPSAGSDYRGQSSYPRRWRKYPNPNICTGCRNGRPHVTLIALVFVTLYIIR